MTKTEKITLERAKRMYEYAHSPTNGGKRPSSPREYEEALLGYLGKAWIITDKG